MQLVIAYVGAGLWMALVDAVWLTKMYPVYQKNIGELLFDGVRFGPAIAFYLLYVFGIVWFAISPALQNGGSWQHAALNGALLGLVCYGTYDLTNQATLKVWPTFVTLMDMSWGAVLTATAAVAGTLAARTWGGGARCQPPDASGGTMARHDRHRLLFGGAGSADVRPAAPGKSGEERRRARLVSVEQRPARPLHVRFQRRQPGDVHQQVVHERRSHDGEQPLRIAARHIQRDYRPGAPRQPLEEIVGMPRQAPQSRVADAPLVGRVRLEASQLPVGDARPDDPRDEDRRP